MNLVALKILMILFILKNFMILVTPKIFMILVILKIMILVIQKILMILIIQKFFMILVTPNIFVILITLMLPLTVLNPDDYDPSYPSGPNILKSFFRSLGSSAVYHKPHQFNYYHDPGGPNHLSYPNDHKVLIISKIQGTDNPSDWIKPSFNIWSGEISD